MAKEVVVVSPIQGVSGMDGFGSTLPFLRILIALLLSVCLAFDVKAARSDVPFFPSSFLRSYSFVVIRLGVIRLPLLSCAVIVQPYIRLGVHSRS